MRRGFSLIELVIVVVIIGIIAAIAVPRMSSAQEHARFTSAHATFCSFERGVLRYQAEMGEFPSWAPPGTPLTELAEFIDEKAFLARPPIGGQWFFAGPSKYDPDQYGVSIDGVPGFDDISIQFETRFDNGDKGSGTYLYDGIRMWRPL